MIRNGESIKKCYIRVMGSWKDANGNYNGYRQEWYKKYKDILKCVENRKLTITSNKLHAINDNKFLERLLLRLDNSIAHANTGKITKKRFKEFIRDKAVLDAIGKVIENPNSSTHDKLVQAVWNCNKNNKPNPPPKKYVLNNWLIVNRVAAACTIDLSSTVAIRKFSEIFSKLVESNMIADYPGRSIFSKNKIKWVKGDEWYKMNIYLMEELSRKFAIELKSGKTDPVLLSVFAWQVWEDNFRKR